MMAGNNYCFQNLSDHEVSNCPEQDYKFGGGDSLALLEEDHNITDWTDQAQWEAAIAADKAVIIKNIKIDWQPGSPATVENPAACGAEEITVGYDQTISWQDANVNDNNDALYAGINGGSYCFVLHECEQEEIRVIERAVSLSIPPNGLPGSNKDIQRYQANGTFSHPRDWYAERHTAPAEIFD